MHREPRCYIFYLTPIPIQSIEIVICKTEKSNSLDCFSLSNYLKIVQSCCRRRTKWKWKQKKRNVEKWTSFLGSCSDQPVTAYLRTLFAWIASPRTDFTFNIQLLNGSDLLFTETSLIVQLVFACNIRQIEIPTAYARKR